jgi:predicted SprT family Zn-dependent metalloprotease
MPCVDQDAAVRLAEGLVAEHLPGWRVRIDGARRRLGACDHARATIALSRHFIALNGADEVRETVLHEIAHARVGRDAGHGAHWRAEARRLGARAERCAGPDVVMPMPRFVGVCPSCGATVQRHARRNVACRACCGAHNGGRYATAFRLIWAEVPEVASS